MQTINLELGWLVLRAVSLLAAMLVLSLAFRHWRQAQSRDAARMFEQLDLLRTEVLLLTERMEYQQRHAAPAALANPPMLNLRPPQPSTAVAAPRGYEVAVRLARSGATRDELVSSCGLSRNEAELLLRLHGPHAQKGYDAKAPEATTHSDRSQSDKTHSDKSQAKADNRHAAASHLSDTPLRRSRLAVVG